MGQKVPSACEQKKTAARSEGDRYFTYGRKHQGKGIISLAQRGHLGRTRTATGPGWRTK